MWLQVDVNTNDKKAHLVAEILMALGSESVTFLATDKARIIEEKKGDISLWRATCVRALFAGEALSDKTPTNGVLIKRIKQTLKMHADISCLSLTELANKNWQKAVDEMLKPMCFNDKLWVVANHAHSVKAKKNDVIIRLAPGLAFGSGSHPSTQLCLKHLTQQPPLGLTVIDYGCGSGILAIAAAKLGAKTVIAVDNDGSALLVCRENALKNKVVVQVQTKDELTAMKADLIIANITAATLVELAMQLQTLLKKSGKILLSGLLIEQAKWVQTAYSAMVFDSKTQQGWCCLLGRLANKGE